MSRPRPDLTVPRPVSRPVPSRPGVRPGGATAVLRFVLALLAALPSGAGAQTMDDRIYTFVSFDELEYRPGLGGEEPVAYDGEMWIGGDYDRLWLKAHGEQSTLAGEGHLEAQALYSRAVSAFWNVQVGLRLDRRYGEGSGATRGHLAAGIQGLAPYWFHVESFLFVSQHGDVSARLEARWEMPFTQRLVLEPEVKGDLALQDVPEWGVGWGLSEVELGARLRYEIRRELAPYVGYSWSRSVGETADLARSGGREASRGSLVVGIHLWH